MVNIKKTALAFLAIIFALVVANKRQESRENAATALAAHTASLSIPSQFDISALESWETEAHGTIHMIGGWYHSEGVIQTEDGHLWGMDTSGMNPYQFVLVWLDDQGTPQVEDDTIFRTWVEMY